MSRNLSFKTLKNLYIKKHFSVSEIAGIFKCSENKINYWLHYYKIPKRTISEAIYIKYNPEGDPFKIKRNLTKEEMELRGLGIGLYWGEGHRKSKWSVKIGNTDSKLIKKFIEFLIKICDIKEEKIKYGLQVFNDADPKEALNFWTRELKISKEKIGKVSALPTRGKGTYIKKNRYGVLSVYVHNMKFKNKLDELVKESIK